jgi:copper(I)-binding protein
MGALSGCGAGQVSQTASQASAVNGYSGQVGSMLVRDASIAFAGQSNSAAIYKTGGTAPLNLTLINQGTQPDKLISASSPIAGSVQIQGDAAIGADQTISVGNTDTPGDASSLAARTIKITLTGLKQDIKAGSNYPVQFTFQRAGTLSANLPVGYPSGALAIRGAEPAPAEPAAAPAGEPKAHAGQAPSSAPGATAGTPATRGAQNPQTGSNAGARSSAAPAAPNPPRTSAPASPNRTSTPTPTAPGNS